MRHTLLALALVLAACDTQRPPDTFDGRWAGPIRQHTLRFDTEVVDGEALGLGDTDDPEAPSDRLFVTGYVNGDEVTLAFRSPSGRMAYVVEGVFDHRSFDATVHFADGTTGTTTFTR